MFSKLWVFGEYAEQNFYINTARSYPARARPMMLRISIVLGLPLNSYYTFQRFGQIIWLVNIVAVHVIWDSINSEIKSGLLSEAFVLRQNESIFACNEQSNLLTYNKSHII